MIRLWEQPAIAFLQSPGLLPFAVLGQVDGSFAVAAGNRTQILQQVARAIDQIADPRVQSNLSASTFVLAGLVLEGEVIQQVLRRDIMQESVTYQLIKQEGREEGREAERQEVAVNLLSEGISLEIVARVTGMTIEQLQQLQNP